MSQMNSDKLFEHLLQNDQVGKPSQAVGDRLMYSFLLKSGGLKTRQNSFVSFFFWLLSTQSIGLKTGLVAAALVISLMNSPISLESVKIASIDSLSTNHVLNVLVADSTRLMQSIDSIQTYNLN